MVSKKTTIYSNVRLGKNCVIEDFVIIGAYSRGHEARRLETVIGDNAFIRSHTVIYEGNKIGANFRTGNKANIRELNEIGDNVSLGTLSVVEHHVKIGSGVRVHSQAFIPEFTVLEDECWIGPNVVITNAKYPKTLRGKVDLKGVHIMKGAIIGANTTLLPDVRIGEYALVGAGSVVTKNVPSRCVVLGNPAKVVNLIDDLSQYK